MAKPQAWSPDDFLSAEAPPAPRAFAPDEFLNAEPDRQVPVGEGALRVSAQAFESAGTLAGAAGVGIAHYAGIAADTVKGLIDPSYVPKETAQRQQAREDTLFDTLQAVHGMVKGVTEVKPEEHLSGWSEGIGGAISMPAQIATWPKPAIDTYMDLKARGASSDEMAQVLLPMVGLAYTANVLPYGIAAKWAGRLGLGTAARTVAGGVGAGAAAEGINVAGRAAENAALPDRPEFNDMRQDVLPKKEDIPGVVTQTLLAAMEGPGHVQAVKEGRASPVDQLKQAEAVMRGANPEPAPQTIDHVPGGEPGVNYDVPPAERGVTGLAKRGVTVEESNGINMPHPNDRAPSMDLSPDNFVDDRPEAPPPAAGIGVAPAGKEVEAIKAATAPADDLAGITDEQITAAPAPKEEAPAITKSDKQVELERLRGLAEDPAVQKDLDTRIKAEAKKAQDAYEAEEKAKADAKTAAEMRALAEKTDDPVIAKALKAKADKLSPEPAPDLLAGQPDQPPAGLAERRAAPRPTTGDNPMKPGEEPSGTRDKLHPGAVVSPHDPVFGSDENGKFLSELPPEKQAERRNATRLALEKAAREKAAAPAEAPPEPSPPTSPAGAAPAEERQHTVGSSPFLKRILNELGGIHSSEVSDTGLDKKKHLNQVFVGGHREDTKGPVFRKTGADMDRVVEWLHQTGHLSDHEISEANANLPGGAHELARDMIRREIDEPGSVKPGREMVDEHERIAEDRWRIAHERMVEEDRAHAEEHGHHIQHMPDLPLVREAMDIDRPAVEALAEKHGDDHKAFLADVGRMLDDHYAKSDDERAGAESRPGGEVEEPAVRREPEKGARVEPGKDALRDQQGAGKPAAGERAATGPEVQPAGAERGAKAAAEAGKPVEDRARGIISEHREKFNRKTMLKGMTPEQFRKYNEDRRASEESAAARLVDLAKEKGFQLPAHDTKGSLGISPDIGGKGKWRVTRFIEDGTPSGHEVYNTPEEAARELLHYGEGQKAKEKPAPVVHPDDKFGPEPGRLYPKPDENITPEWRDQVKEHIGKLTDDQVRDDLARAERNIAKKESLTKADRHNIDPEKFKVDVEAKKEIRNLLKDELAKREAGSFSLENPTPESLKAREQAAKDAATGQQSMIGAEGQTESRPTIRDMDMKQTTIHDTDGEPKTPQAKKEHATMQTHIAATRSFLDSLGLGWMHKDTRYEIARDRGPNDLGYAGWEDGVYTVGLTPKMLAGTPSEIAHAMLHEHAHVMDMGGNLYSHNSTTGGKFDAAWYPGPKPGQMHMRGGDFAVELMKAAEKNPQLKAILEYPMSPEYARTMDRSRRAGEIFAQAFAAYHSNLREFLKNEAPKTVEWIEQAMAHAKEGGLIPQGTDAAPDILRQRADFNAKRPAGGGNQPRARGNDVRQSAFDFDRTSNALDAGERSIRSMESHMDKPNGDDEKEARTFGKILRDNFKPAQLRRMAEAAREENVKLEKGTTGARGEVVHLQFGPGASSQG